MLSPTSWSSLVSGLEVGKRKRCSHDCGSGGTLLVSRDAQGYHAYCFRCNDSGFLNGPQESLDARLKRLSGALDADIAARTVNLPEGGIYSWQAWPPAARLWLLKAGLSAHDLPELGAYYHPPTNRVVLPCFRAADRHCEFWQARSIDGRVPKYLAPPVDKAGVIPMYGSAPTVTLTEDILSAYKVGKVGEGWCLLGTKLNQNHLTKLMQRGCVVNVWLDPDPPGQAGANKALAKLRSVGIVCRNIVTDVDPKLMHLGAIKELLS
jgi:DNA primase